MKKLVALALGTVMAVSMTAGVSAATVESKDDLKNATIGVQLGTTGDIEASEYEADGATVKRYSKGSEAIQALMAQHHKLKKKMERNLFAGSFHCVKI